MKLSGVILTGARNANNPLLVGTGVHNKVLLPVGEKPMVLSVLEALSQSRYRPELYISTNDLEISRLKAQVSFQSIPSEAKAVQSFLKSLERVPGEWVLFVSGDHVLVTPEMIDYFIDEVIRRDLVLGVAAVNRNLVNQYYPQTRRTYFHVKGGAYSGGNLFLVNKQKFMANAEILEMIDNNRKKPWKSLPVLGIGSVFQVLFRQIDIHEVARRASKLIGCESGIVEMPFAECCMDVDKPSDKAIAEMILAHRQQERSELNVQNSCA